MPSIPSRLGLCATTLLCSVAATSACVLPGSPQPEPLVSGASPLAGGTLLLQDPTISAEHIVFRYAEDLWVVGRQGGEARRLTSSPGRESSPQLSPDGKLVAFTGSYEGNPDVYVLPIDGGTPRRLTYHPGGDTVQDWLPDGSGVVFTSMRNMSAPAGKAFVASLDGGTPTALELPKVNHLAVDAGAERFAYTSTRDAFGTWKRYRGGRLASVWIYDRASREVEVVPMAGANDSFPAWLGDDVHFASDRDGVMNLYAFTPGDDDVRQLTAYTDFDVRAIDTGAGALVFEQAGSLHVLDPASGAIEDLVIEVRSDGLAATPRWQTVEGHVRSGDIAPNGKRAVFSARGEILSLPRENGSRRNLTQTPGAHDRNPIWSPDGEQIAWLSDASGEYQLHVGDRLGREEPKAFDLGGDGFYYSPSWSPDGAHVLFNDKGNRIAFVTLETGEVTMVASVQGSLGTVQPTAVWSPDSTWIAFEDRNPRTLYDTIALYELETGATTTVTDAFAFASNPAFSSDGGHLYFVASTNRGSSLMGLNMSTSASRDWDGSLYVAVLTADGENPLAPRNDEAVDEQDAEDDGEEPAAEDAAEEGDDSDDADDADGGDEVAEDTDAESTDEPEEYVPSIDLEGLGQRILALPLGRGLYSNLAAAGDALLFIERDDSGSRLRSFDFEGRKAETLDEGARGFSVSADGKSLLIASRSSFKITNAQAKDAKTVDVDSMRVRVDPAQEWPQTLREVWRIQRDYFYDPNFHGVDWPAMWERWEPFLAHVQHRADLTLIIQQLIGELACGHQYVNGGEYPDGPGGISVGLLGADFEADSGMHRIARIHAGQNWNASGTSPLTLPGVDVREGDYLLAVDGVELSSADNVYAAFVDTVGKLTELTLASDAAGTDQRTALVTPIGSEWSLRRSSWIEDCRRRVDEASGGRLAYIYMPNTGGQGMNSFDRDFYSQLDREGLILDERYNGGGQVADYVIETLERDVMSYWLNREGWVGVSPSALLEGPKVMVINESAGSGGDWMPWAFQRRGIGQLVGTRTWGGLVGISGYPPLMDGGSVTSANFGVMDPEGNWVVENVGVTPDHEVIEWPAPIMDGADPQLDRAIELALEALEQHQPRPLPKYVPPTPR